MRERHFTTGLLSAVLCIPLSTSLRASPQDLYLSPQALRTKAIPHRRQDCPESGAKQRQQVQVRQREGHVGLVSTER